MDTIYIGNFKEDAATSDPKGWFVGHFMPKEPQKTGTMEIKYWSFPDGKTAHQPKVQEHSLEVTLVLKGTIRGHAGGQAVELSAGQYIVTPAGVPNNIVEWAEGGAEGLAIKAPSLANDTKR
jgi:quercetin dioxygenase-like cupin family protein